jgi:hypothetical protein
MGTAKDHAAILLLAATVGASCSPTSPTPASPQAPATPLAEGPPASAGHNLVYADHLGMVVLVNAGLGGAPQPPATTPTRVWGWTGTEWRLLDASGPPIRNLAGVAYDRRRQTLVMHGGSYDLARFYGETWEWSAAWRQVAASGPGSRDHTQLAYDAARGRAVLFGGAGQDARFAIDTWEFDGTSWARVATGGPPARVHHAMSYDPATRRVVAFGGIDPDGTPLGDTWSWNGSRWTPLGTPAAPRSHARMAHHGGLGALVVVGGRAAAAGLDMIVQRDQVWMPLPSTPEPSARYLTDIAYDERRGVMVLFGGAAPNGPLLGDTWEMDVTTWRRIR